jgi:hypothetical protein
VPSGPCDRPSGPAEEDVGQRGPLLVAGAGVDVEHDLPRGTRLHPVQVADRQHRPQAGQVDSTGVTVADGPGQGAEALPETGRAAGAAADAAARADRLAVASLKIRALHPPVGHRAGPCCAHHLPHPSRRGRPRRDRAVACGQPAGAPGTEALRVHAGPLLPRKPGCTVTQAGHRLEAAQAEADASAGAVSWKRHVNAGTACEMLPKTLPRKRHGRGCQRHNNQGAPCPRHERTPARYSLRICSLRMSACPQCWASSRSTWRYTQRSGSGPRQ